MDSMRNDERESEITNLTYMQGYKEWWDSQSFVSSLQALLKLRKIVYGDAVTGRLQRVLESTDLTYS